MASIASENFHNTVQRLDNEALVDTNEGGLHAPTLLEVLDLRYWTMLLGGLKNIMWMHPNVNHLAPITVDLWKCWASLSD